MPELKTKYKHIYMVRCELATKRKTSIWMIKNSRSHGDLGMIKWYRNWREYCFYPFHETVFNVSCLNDIKHFIGQLKAGKDKPKPARLEFED